MTQKGQRDHRAGKPQDANSPKGRQETRRVCRQDIPSMPYGGSDPWGARVLSCSGPGAIRWLLRCIPPASFMLCHTWQESQRVGMVPHHDALQAILSRCWEAQG